MPRPARLIEEGVALHVVARGNYRQTIFHNDDDRQIYLKRLAYRAANHEVQILGWCLMTNHVHLLIVPTIADGVSKLFRSLQSEFAMHVNQKSERVQGHLWQGRFYSCPLAFARIWTALRYIELNPVRAGVVKQSTDSRWSSAIFHAGLEPPPDFLRMDLWQQTWNSPVWRQMLGCEQNEDEVKALRAATVRGVPWGDEQFVKRFEERVGHKLVCRRVGRPRLASA